MFVWKASVILEQFKEFLPEVYACLVKIGDAMGTDSEMEAINEIYPVIPSISIDYGSWDNLGVLHDTDANGNIVAGNHLAIDTNNCITYSKKRLITTVGVENLIIVETDDAILVCDKNRAQDVKLIVDQLKKEGRDELL